MHFKRSLPPSAIVRGARIRRLRESVGDLETELATMKVFIAASEADLEGKNRELAEAEEEFNRSYGIGTSDRGKVSLTDLGGGPSQLKAPKEESELKMNKLAVTSAANTCTLCNVVCNSKTVYDSHLAGRKHAVMVKKKAEAEV